MVSWSTDNYLDDSDSSTDYSDNESSVGMPHLLLRRGALLSMRTRGVPGYKPPAQTLVTRQLSGRAKCTPLLAKYMDKYVYFAACICEAHYMV